MTLRRGVVVAWGLIFGILLVACSDAQQGLASEADAGTRPADAGTRPTDAGTRLTDAETRPMRVDRLFPAGENTGITFRGCLFASPLAYEAGGTTQILVVESGGTLASLHSQTGAELWRITLPSTEPELPVVVATPVIVKDKLVVAYHTSPSGSIERDDRRRQVVVVVDLARRALDAAFPPLNLAAELPAGDGDGLVSFRVANSLARGALVHGVARGQNLGNVYVTFGNARDIQPWHGWIFEIDLDRWLREGAGYRPAALVTTAASDCGVPGHSGSRERVCGGGLWAPSGPLLIARGDSYELILAPGNGQLDLSMRAYANTLMRVQPGLSFTPGCDARRCSAFNADDPAASCIETCAHLFVPRVLPGEEPPRPESGVCDGASLFECWEKLDYTGGSTPSYVELRDGSRVLAYPSKDGYLYLVDANHLGTMHDRAQLVSYCGTKSDRCAWDWAGMIVTQPAFTRERDPIAVVPTFMPDKTHPAGIVGVRISSVGGKPRLQRAWEYPPFSSSAAVARFRRHPSLPALATHFGQQIAWVVEVTGAPPERGAKGRLLGIDATVGQPVADVELAGAGRRFVRPLVLNDTVYVPSCAGHNDGPGSLEAYRLRR